MPDISAIAGLMTSVKASGDIAKALLGLRDGALIQAKAAELTAEIIGVQGQVFAVQAAHSALLDEARALKEEVVKLKDWQQEAQRYRLAEVRPGAFVYALKPGMEAGEPAHQICAGCYQDGRKSILQGGSREDRGGTTGLLRCDRCKAEIAISFQPYPAPARSRVRTGPDWSEFP